MEIMVAQPVVEELKELDLDSDTVARILERAEQADHPDDSADGYLVFDVPRHDENIVVVARDQVDPRSGDMTRVLLEVAVAATSAAALGSAAAQVGVLASAAAEVAKRYRARSTNPRGATAGSPTVERLG